MPTGEMIATTSPQIHSQMVVGTLGAMRGSIPGDEGRERPDLALDTSLPPMMLLVMINISGGFLNSQ